MEKGLGRRIVHYLLPHPTWAFLFFSRFSLWVRWLMILWPIPRKIFSILKHQLLQFSKRWDLYWSPKNPSVETLDKAVALLPRLLNSSATLITNLALMLFILYNMLLQWKRYGKISFQGLATQTGKCKSPCGRDEKHDQSECTRNSTHLNHPGGICHDWVCDLWCKGLCALGICYRRYLHFFPWWVRWLFGCRLFFQCMPGGDSLNATGLLLYSIIVTGNVDYLARITLLKKIGNVNAVITILGVIVGPWIVWFYRFDLRTACWSTM